MNNVILSPPQFGFVLGTRVAGALGVGLLLASKLSSDRRRQVGTGLMALGALTSIPAVWTVLRSRRRAQGNPRINRADATHNSP